MRLPEKAFLERQKLALELLSDSGEELVRQLGLPVWQSPAGERFLERITLVFRKSHGLVDLFRDPAPDEHARRALKTVQTLTER